MLSEATAAQIFSEIPTVPDCSFKECGSRPSDNELQYNTAIYSEADDIAAFIVDTGITYCEAVFTFASDKGITEPVGHSVLVTLRVLKLLSSRRPINLPVYASTFELPHLLRIFSFLRVCNRKQPPPHRLFMPNEPQPWEAMEMECSELIGYVSLPQLKSNKPKTNRVKRAPKPTGGKAHPKLKAEKYLRSLKKRNPLQNRTRIKLLRHRNRKRHLQSRKQENRLRSRRQINLSETERGKGISKAEGRRSFYKTDSRKGTS